jgi:hypothetical protein
LLTLLLDIRDHNAPRRPQLQTFFDADLARPRPGLRITADELAELLPAAAAGAISSSGGASSSGGGGGGVVILDTRNAEQYEGQVRRAWAGQGP